jgi:iron complex outermembrane receptor protein
VLSAVMPRRPWEAFDPVSGSYLLGRSVFQNDPVAYSARGIEAGVTWSATKGLDLRVTSALQQVQSLEPSVTVCGPCTQAPAFKLFAGASYRASFGLDVSVDVSLTTGMTWVEREPDPADPTRIANLQNPLPAYVVLNARAGYRFFDDRLSIAVVGTQLGPSHQEHPFGNLVSRRVMATVTVRP